MVSLVITQTEKSGKDIDGPTSIPDKNDEAEGVDELTVPLNNAPASAAVCLSIWDFQENDEPPVYSVVDPLTSGGTSAASSIGGDDDSDNLSDTPEGDENEPDPEWSELDFCGKVKRVVVKWIGKFVTLLVLLYVFVCSLDFLSSAFRLLGGKTAGTVFGESELLQNPITGLMIGILGTVLVQSSSTSTSIVVTMVASGILEVQPAIPIVMGANIGTSVTNTIVSMAQSGDRREFRRAFSGATVHDMFNWLSVLILLPVEVATGYLYQLTSLIVSSFEFESTSTGNKDMLKLLTAPFTKLVIQVDKKVIEKIAAGHKEYADKSLIKRYCDFEDVSSLENVTSVKNLTSFIRNGSVLVNVTEEMNITSKVGTEKCISLFSYLDLSDTVSGIILLIFSIIVLCVCLVLMVRLLHSVLKGAIAKSIRETINADFPGCFAFLSGYVAIVVGAIMTMLVQSSSIFTSALTPLVGMGLIQVERMYPLTLGSNIGTTATSILAALAAPGDKLDIAIQISLCHLFFNISGILIFYPIPVLRRIPIRLSKYLGKVTGQYRWFAIFYLIIMFFVIPTLVFCISMTGRLPSIIIFSVLLFTAFIIMSFNIAQRKYPKVLPVKLRTWEFLPSPLRSLQPLDSLIVKLVTLKKYCCCCRDVEEGRISSESYKWVTSDISPVSSRTYLTSLGTTPISSRASSRIVLQHASNI